MKLARLWRLTRAPYADLRGEGARLYGGRWNPVGTPMVYACTSLALAILETLVHTDPDLVPGDLVAMEIDPGDADAEAPAVETLPPRWRLEIGRVDTQTYGERWAKEKRSPLIVLPSVLLPLEDVTGDKTVLLNPLHPQASTVRVVRVLAFTMDPRLIEP